jgi:hypothetical protein
MALKQKVCGVLRVLRIHRFDCELCGLANECEGRLMRERLQELCREITPAPAKTATPPAGDDAA